MQFFREELIESYFDISIILPFYRRVKEFSRIMPKNQYFFQRNGIEVIIVLNEDSEEQELLDYIDGYPLINWQVIINREQQKARSRSRALNVGIRHATFKYVLIMGPEVELLSDVIYQLRYIIQHYPNSFAIGSLIFTGFDVDINKKNYLSFPSSECGNILVAREALEKVGGYDEAVDSLEGEDNNIITRLELAGFNKKIVKEAIAIYREDNPDRQIYRNKNVGNNKIEITRKSFFPFEIVVNDKDTWGRDFNELCFSWKNNKSIKYRDQVLKSFESFDFPSSCVFEHNYKIIALIQTRNERKYIPNTLLHLDDYCDGIILLDDGSTDSTFENAYSKKLLLKVKKKHANYFDDLGNRNQLLKLSHLFSAEWFFFIDADENFLEGTNLYTWIENQNVDNVLFRLIHLWDDKIFYRKDLPEGENGILQRYRMFRSKGFLQILSTRELHFPTIPYTTRSCSSNILLKHFGLLDKKVRQLKYEKYTKQDHNGKKQGYNYEYLLDENPLLGKIDDLSGASSSSK